MRKLLAQFTKFGIVGVIAFIIDYGLMVLLTEVFGINYLISTTVSFIVSVIFNYLASMRYVFKHKEGMSLKKEFIIFVVLSIIGLGLNDVLMYFGTSILTISYLITKIGATAIVMVYNFITRKIFLDDTSSESERQSDNDKKNITATQQKENNDAFAPVNTAAEFMDNIE